MQKNAKRRAAGGAAVLPKRMQGAAGCAAVRRSWPRSADGAVVRRRMQRAMRCAAVLALIFLFCGDMVLPQQQDPLLPELSAVEQQLRALTADTPDGWRYSLRVSPSFGGGTLTADAARRDASGGWETIHTLWRPENGTWRMVRQTHRVLCPPPGAEAEHE